MNKRLLQGAFLLTIAALCTKALSIGYRIPYQNITGDIGFYVYQQVYPIHGIVFTLAMYGFPVVIAKLIAEQKHLETQIVYVSFFVLTAVCAAFFTILFLISPVLANVVGDSELAPLYKTIAFTVLFVPFISALRGVFQAQEYVIPTALSQIAEQFVRVIVIVTLAVYFIKQGFGVYTAGLGAAAGSIAGAVASVITLSCFYWRVKPSFRFRSPIQWKNAVRIGKRLIVQGFVISIGALTFVLFQLVDSVTVVKQLLQFGYTAVEAKSLKGVYDRSQPLLQLGFTLATSLSLVVVPAIASAFARQDEREIRNKAGIALKVTFIISIAASLGLAIIAEPTNVMLFTDSRGSVLLATVGFAIFFGSLALTSIAILQGIDKVKETLQIVGFGFMIKCFVNIVFIPIYGIYAAALGTVAGFFAMAAYSFMIVHVKLKIFQAYPFYFLRILLAALGMTFTVFIWKLVAQTYIFSEGRLAAAGLALSSVLIAIVTYSCLLLASRVFTRAEIDEFKRQREGVEREN